jgi:uncharacterized protein YqfB (UPF0267 family)
MSLHDLKTEKQFFDDIISGTKTFEIRYNDRDYLVGDYLLLRDFNSGEYTGRIILCKVLYVLSDPGNRFLQPGYVCMSIKMEAWNKRGTI